MAGHGAAEHAVRPLAPLATLWLPNMVGEWMPALVRDERASIVDFTKGLLLSPSMDAVIVSRSRKQIHRGVGGVRSYASAAAPVDDRSHCATSSSPDWRFDGSVSLSRLSFSERSGKFQTTFKTNNRLEKSTKSANS
jgi:hypothetical protein